MSQTDLLNLLICSSYIVPDFDGVIDDYVEVAACFEYCVDINEHVIYLGD